MRKYYVYRITNVVNRKIYIGVHATENFDDGYMGSGVALRKAMREHGRECFVKEMLFEFDNPEDMIRKEAELVDETFLSRDDVYNLKAGGGWSKPTRRSRRGFDPGNAARVLWDWYRATHAHDRHLLIRSAAEAILITR